MVRHIQNMEFVIGTTLPNAVLITDKITRSQISSCFTSSNWSKIEKERNG